MIKYLLIFFTFRNFINFSIIMFCNYFHVILFFVNASQCSSFVCFLFWYLKFFFRDVQLKRIYFTAYIFFFFVFISPLQKKNQIKTFFFCLYRGESYLSTVWVKCYFRPSQLYIYMNLFLLHFIYLFMHFRFEIALAIVFSLKIEHNV